MTNDTFRETRGRELLVYLGAASASLVVGASIVQGGTISLALSGMAVGMTLLFVASALRERALIWWPVLSVSLYPFLRFPSDHAIITFDRLWIVALVGILLARSRAVPTTETTRRLTTAFILFVGWYGLRALTTGAYSSAGRLGPFGSWIDAAFLPFLLFVAARRLFSTTERVRRLAAALALAGAVMAGIGIAERIFGFELASRSGGQELFDLTVRVVRVSGPYPGTEMFIVGLLVCFAATLYWIQSSGPGTYLPGAIAACLQVTALGLTLFRISWLLIPLVVIIAFGLRPKKFTRTVTVVVVVSICGFLAFSVLEHNDVFSTRLTGQVAQKNITGRLATYDQGYRIFRKSPLVGVGVNRFSKAAADTPIPVRNGIRALGFPHNSYLGILAEQGAIGFVALVFLSFTFWRLTRKLRQEARSREDVILAAAVTAAVSAYFLASLTLFLIAAGPANAFLALFVGAAAGRVDAARASSSASAPLSDGL